MSIIYLVLNFILGTLSFMVFFIVPFFVVAALLCVPYWLYLGCYKKDNGLPDDFRKTGSVFKEIKFAAKFYWDLLHFRKPTF